MKDYLNRFGTCIAALAFSFLLLGAGALPRKKPPINCIPLFTAFSDPTDVKIVVLSGNGTLAGPIQDQIIQSLPEGVSHIRVNPTEREYVAPTPWIRDWFPFLVTDIYGKPWQLKFGQRNTNNFEAAQLMRYKLLDLGIPVNNVRIFLDGGNVVTNGEKVFISKSKPLLMLNNHYYGIDEKMIKNEIERAFGKEVVWLPELPREGTGHADVFVTWAGEKKFIVADSIDLERKAALDSATKIIKSYGYEVVRIKNAGPDTGETAMTYTNSLIVGNRALVPVYSQYAKIAFKPNPGVKVFWKLVEALAKSRPQSSPFVKNEKLLEQIANDAAAAIQTYASLGYEVYPIYMNKVVDLNGMVHCMTTCLPSSVRAIFDPKNLSDYTK